MPPAAATNQAKRRKLMQTAAPEKCGKEKAAAIVEENTLAAVTTGVPSCKCASVPQQTSLASQSSSRRCSAGLGMIQVSPMTDSSLAYRHQCWCCLRDRFRVEGFLLLRKVLLPSSVTQAQRFLLEHLYGTQPHQFGGTLKQGWLANGAGREFGLLQQQYVAAEPVVRRVLEAPQLFDLVRQLLQTPDVITSGYKWLRAVGRDEFTGLHTDRVFLGRGSSALVTVWIPLGAVPHNNGALLVVRGSHASPSLSLLRSTYGQSEVGEDGTKSGWLSHDGSVPSRGEDAPALDWVSADFQPGDIVVLGLDVLHMTARNENGRIRLSCDSRWQPAEDPRDPRIRVWRDAPFDSPGSEAAL